MRQGGKSSTWVAMAIVLVASLVAFCFRSVLFGGEQFGFRDAAHHYYPLHLRVQQEWQAGRVPLWDAWQNGGMPLLGNPTAAVFYPGKLVFACLPYAWAARVYVILHVPLAFAGMVGLLRSWRCGRTAALLGGLSYAFGGPILQLHSNVIYLVGAAWLPFVLWSMHSWFRTGGTRALAGVGFALAMCVLGGDPQMAYLAVVAGLVQATCRRVRVPACGRRWGVGALVAALFLSWCVVWLMPAYAASWGSWPWGGRVERILRAVVVVAVVGLLWARLAKRQPGGWWTIAGVGCAAGLGLLAAAIQVIPTAEFVAGSTRGEAGAGLDRYGFSLVPYRLVEMLWPGVLGSGYPTNASWRSALPPAGDPTFWVPTLYVGGLTLALAGIGAWRGQRRLRRGLLWSVAIAVLGSFGLYAAPAGLSRWLGGAVAWLPLPAMEHVSGAHDDFRSGIGGPYWWLANVLPGFDLFRYPSKLFNWAALGCAGLAAIGWDAVERRPRRSDRWVVGGLLGLTALAGVAFFAWTWTGGNGGIAARASATTGPFQWGRAARLSSQGLIHGFVVYLGALVVLVTAAWRSRWAKPLSVCVMVADLGIAGAPWIWTVPQSWFETKPAALAAIEAAEQAEPNSGPIRIHRPTVWHPFGWFRDASARRLEEIVAFERNSLQALHGLPFEVGYVFTLGVLEPEAHLRNFRPWQRPLGAELGSQLGMSGDTPGLYFPRKAFDLWSARYFVVPVDALNWLDENRAYASFLENAEVIAPDVKSLKRAGTMDAWRIGHDWQVLRNQRAFPRAWAVHEALVIAPLDQLDARQRDIRLRNFLYQGDAFWSEPGRSVVDLHKTAWVEAIDPRAVRLALETGGADVVAITHYDPQRVVVNAELGARGLVILADAFAPGWELTVDGKAAAILRTNLGMRGAVVGAGAHVLEYRYRPKSFWWGAALSVVGMAALAGLFAWSFRERWARKETPRVLG